MIGILSNLPELIGYFVSIGLAFWVGRLSLNWHPFNWIANVFRRK